MHQPNYVMVLHPNNFNAREVLALASVVELG
jgi:hypothetical protein